MPNKPKKEKANSKGPTINTKPNGKENTENVEEANKTNGKVIAPPNQTPAATQAAKVKYPAPAPVVKKDRRPSMSRFSISKNRELQKLPLLKGMSRPSRARLQCVSYIKGEVQRATYAGGKAQHITKINGE
ncbi:PREDICTED: serine/threonine-protein phosphatase 2A 56 kDa regulatory subunit delta isoform-like, partial [Priapulus caudatus]|uniref:Serine/threonine-protein phosphatase 2A 56 kDa regulatory subunit delta isoform-like n=1 Tax=Priapulus caudatus TaxID=37621 RepID=A0ABM1EGG7_PRICU